MFSNRARALCYRFSKSIWLYPALLLLPLLVLSILRISGSSISAYPMNYGVGISDPGIISGLPRGVRSDEWLVTTQMTVAQSANNFKKINTNIGNGEDMSLIGDTPYKDWSTFFRPQNLIFFIVPLENAFAFKWWLLLYLLLISSYFFALRLFQKQRLKAALFSIVVGGSPFVFWWYSTGTLGCIFYSFFLLAISMRMVNKEPFFFLKKYPHKYTRILYALVLAYLLIAFALLLYPPFQIPCFIAVLVFIAGWILDNYNGRKKLKGVLALWPYLALTAILVLTVGSIFYLSHRGTISIITHTVYPGMRIEPGGGTDPLLISSSFLSPNLQYDDKAIAGYLGNQSEASNFIFVAPFLLLPSLYLVYLQKKRHNKILWGLVLTNILIIFFLMKMYVASPILEPLYKLFLLEKVPNTRMLMGVGFAGILQLALIIKELDSFKLRKKDRLWKLALFGGASGLAVMLAIGAYTIKHFPVFISNPLKVAVFSTWIALGIFFIIQKRTKLGLALLVLFTLFSVYKVQPIYRGLGPLTTSEPIASIKAYPNDGGWLVLDDRLMINFPLMAGKHSINSVYFYPQLSLWHQIDKKNTYAYTYNRYAHVVFIDDQKMTEPFTLKYADTLYVKFEPCKDFIQTEAKYVLSDKILSDGCVRLDKKIHMKQKDMYIYKITSPSVKSI